MSRSYALREHTADVAVEATGERLDDAFAAAADGLAAAMCDGFVAGGERFALTVTAESREAVLFDYLDRLIYERDVRGVLPVDNEATVFTPGDDGTPDSDPDSDPDADSDDNSDDDPDADSDDPGDDGPWRIEASARGLPLSAVDAREVKAVTYSEMSIERVDGGWAVYVVLDV